MVKNPPANAGNTGDKGSIPGWERSPRVGTGNPLQYSCLENSLDRGAWQSAVHGMAESDRAERLTSRGQPGTQATEGQVNEGLCSSPGGTPVLSQVSPPG